MPITERLILHVKGAVEDWSPAVKILLQTLKTQEGYVRTRWGPQMENMNNLEFLIGKNLKSFPLILLLLPTPGPKY